MLCRRPCLCPCSCLYLRLCPWPCQFRVCVFHVRVSMSVSVSVSMSTVCIHIQTWTWTVHNGDTLRGNTSATDFYLAFIPSFIHCMCQPQVRLESKSNMTLVGVSKSNYWACLSITTASEVQRVCLLPPIPPPLIPTHATGQVITRLRSGLFLGCEPQNRPRKSACSVGNVAAWKVAEAHKCSLIFAWFLEKFFHRDHFIILNTVSCYLLRKFNFPAPPPWRVVIRFLLHRERDL
jgi:hypothetical protein